jgi:hypothetical protein
MTQEIEPRAATTPPKRSLWPIVAMMLGAAVVITGVALNESGVALGRTLIVVGLPLGLAGLVLVLLATPVAVAAAVSPQPDVAATVAAVARHWGMSLEGNKTHGTVKRREVEIAHEGNDGPVVVRAQLIRALDMGLSVLRGGRPPGDARREFFTGDTAFDATYCVRVDEPERARKLLTERLRQQLMTAHASLDDEGVRLVVPPGEPRELTESVRLACRAASEVDRASSQVPCAEGLGDLRDAWLAFASEHQLASADTPLSIWGELDGLTVQAVAMRDAFQHYHFELRADFPVPLGRGLEMRPASTATQFDRSGEPIGHPAFDKIFVIKAQNRLDPPRLVGPETREAILALRDAGVQLRIRDHGLWAWVGLKRDEPRAVPEGLARLALIGSRIDTNARRFPATAPPPRSSARGG